MSVMDFIEVILWVGFAWCILGWIGVFREGDREYDRFKRKIERARLEADANYRRQEEREQQRARSESL